MGCNNGKEIKPPPDSDVGQVTLDENNPDYIRHSLIPGQSSRQAALRSTASTTSLDDTSDGGDGGGEHDTRPRKPSAQRRLNFDKAARAQEAAISPDRPNTPAIDGDLREVLEQCFELFDTNHDGQLDIQEVTAAGNQLGHGIFHGQQGVQLFMDTADTNHDGTVSIEEFLRMNSTLVKTYRKFGWTDQKLAKTLKQMYGLTPAKKQNVQTSNSSSKSPQPVSVL